MKKTFFISTFIFLLFLGLHGQDKAGSPFPSGISAELSGVDVIISWKDSTYLEDELYHIYRHTQPITGLTFSQAEFVGTVEAGKELFVDKPDHGGDWYYQVTAEDNRNHYSIAIPHRNATVSPVIIENEMINLQMAVVIDDLKASVMNGKIVISFIKNRSDRSVSLYRSTSPITVESSLSQALFLTVLEGSKHTWIDDPIPGIPYYYAVVDRELLVNDYPKKILYEGNYTLTPAALPLTEFLDNPYSVLPIRKAPLPTLKLEKYYDDLPLLDVTFPDKTVLLPQLERKLSALLKDRIMGTLESPEPSILNNDKSENGTPLEEQLKLILGEFFLKERWNRAESELLTLIDESDDIQLNSRIHYYRGQCFYFLKKYEMSYFEFLLSRENHYIEATNWMEECLDQLL